MPTIVFTRFWAQRAGILTPHAPAHDDQSAEAQFEARFEGDVRAQVSKALAHELSDLIDHSTRVLAMPRQLGGVMRRGYYIMATIQVDLSAPALDERLALCQRVEHTLKRALEAICGEVLVEGTEIKGAAPGSVERRG